MRDAEALAGERCRTAVDPPAGRHAGAIHASHLGGQRPAAFRQARDGGRTRRAIAWNLPGDVGDAVPQLPDLEQRRRERMRGERTRHQHHREREHQAHGAS